MLRMREGARTRCHAKESGWVGFVKLAVLYQTELLDALTGKRLPGAIPPRVESVESCMWQQAKGDVHAPNDY